MKNTALKSVALGLAAALIFISCSTHQKVVRVEPQVQSIKQEQGLKRKVAIARFSSETQHAKGVFYSPVLIKSAEIEALRTTEA